MGTKGNKSKSKSKILYISLSTESSSSAYRRSNDFNDFSSTVAYAGGRRELGGPGGMTSKPSGPLKYLQPFPCVVGNNFEA